MNELRFEGARGPGLTAIDASFESGSHVVLGNESDGTSALLALAAANARPTRGRVLLNGVSIWNHAQMRRSTASLCPSEPLLPARDVEGALAFALQARGDGSRSARAVLDAAGLAHLAPRRSSALGQREARAVAFALAAAHPEPRLVVLHEPLDLLGLVSEAFIRDTVQGYVAAGAVVLSSASRWEDAERLNGNFSLLERGVWLGPATAEPVLGVTFRVLTPEPRRLAARLSEAPDVAAVEWAGGHELLVRGPRLEALARSVVANARAEAIRITALKHDAPALSAIVAARAAMGAVTGAATSDALGAVGGERQTSEPRV